MKFEDPNSRVEPICLITICDKNIYETIKMFSNLFNDIEKEKNHPL
jgi:hypothetical protein